MTQSSDRPPEMSPVVEWFSRHGVKAVGVLLLIELLFHVYAISSTKRREAAPSTASPTTVMDSVD